MASWISLRHVLLGIIASALGLVACASDPSSQGDTDTGGDGTGDGDGDGDGSGDGDGDGDDACLPTFGGTEDSVFDQTPDRFTLTVEEGWTILDGAVLDGDALELFVEAERVGACRLLTHETSFCDPMCPSGEACVDEECIAYPSQASVGTLSLQQVQVDPISVEPTDQNRYFWFSDAVGASDFDEVMIAAPGAEDTEAFELDACAEEALEPEGDWADALATRGAGEDVSLSWSNPIEGARVYLRMTTGIGTHGGISPVEVECEGPDTGTLTLPGSYLDALYEPSYWSCGECGLNELKRYRASEVQAGVDLVQLRVESTTSFWHIP
jgi:hypothetical protein